MAFTVPVFPLSCGIYTTGLFPGPGPRLVTVCNIAYGKRVMTQWWDWGSPPNIESSVFTCLLFPALTDVRDYSSSTHGDVIECPVGSGRTYYVDFVDDLGKGFANEHRFALCEKFLPWPTPIP